MMVEVGGGFEAKEMLDCGRFEMKIGRFGCFEGILGQGSCV